MSIPHSKLASIGYVAGFPSTHYIYVKSAASCCERDRATQLSRPRPRPW